MELKYPWILIIGIPLLIFLIVFKIKKENKYKTGIKIDNMHLHISIINIKTNKSRNIRD